MLLPPARVLEMQRGRLNKDSGDQEQSVRIVRVKGFERSFCTLIGGYPQDDGGMRKRCVWDMVVVRD
jgi:hypothetical protein